MGVPAHGIENEEDGRHLVHGRDARATPEAIF